MEITISIPEALVTEARSSGLSPETFVERLLERVASASERAGEDRVHLRNQLDADWNHCKQTGLHLNGDDVDA